MSDLKSNLKDVFASEAITIQDTDSDPINWQNDDDALLIRKIRARVQNTKDVHVKKMKQCREADAYIDGEPNKVDDNKKEMIFNPLFPILRDQTGIVADSKPNPAIRIVRVGKDLSKDVLEEMRATADKLGLSLEEWWDDIGGQSKLQKIVIGMYSYADYFIMPYWNAKKKDVDIEMLKPTRVRIDSSAKNLEEAEETIIDFYKSKKYVLGRFGEDKMKKLTFSDKSEIQLSGEDDDENVGEHTLLKNVVKIQLYMDEEYWCYKSQGEILEKMRNPFWALTEEEQREDRKGKIKAKYEKKGLKKAGQKISDGVKKIVGGETTDDKINEDVDSAMASFKPRSNFHTYPKIPVIQFDTYRFGSEQYSRSLMKQSIRLVDSMNNRKHDIDQNSKDIGRPTTFVNGDIMNEDQARKINDGRMRNKVVRVTTKEGTSINENIKVKQGTPLPAQFFNDMADSKRDLDDFWGLHPASKGKADSANPTKGGILALQEADQTPIRFVTRNIEEALQSLFGWVVQIRKMYMDEDVIIGEEDSINYDDIDDRYRVFVKSGSMLPVSKEAQRDEALFLWKAQALDPLSLFEALNYPDPEKTAKRLEAWKQGQILDESMEEQKQRVLDKIQAIQANKFEDLKGMVAEDDDPKIHHDMLVMALQSEQFTPEQENALAELIEHYAGLAGDTGQQQV